MNNRYKFILLYSVFVLLFSCAPKNGSVFTLDSNQSMLMSGKGPGQDGAINPYYGEKCVAIVKNLGASTIEVRIQNQNGIVSITQVKPKHKQRFSLEQDDQIYFDTTASSKVKLSFRPS